MKNDEMKVLLMDTTCAFLTPGGKTTHALKLQKYLSEVSCVKVEFARWWDASQSDADVIHFLEAIPDSALEAKRRGIKTFFSMIMDFQTNLTGWPAVKMAFRTYMKTHLPFGLSNRISSGKWNAYPYIDKFHFMHEQDRNTGIKYYPKYITPESSVVIPHAYDPDDMYISRHLDITQMGFPRKYLISCANINPRKQTVLLAQMAKRAEVPIVFMGSKVDTDPYFLSFQSEIDNKFVFYPGYVSKEWRDCIERNAAGYVLLSTGESGCIAVYEAAAYKMPLLLSNMPWAWGYDTPTDISFCDFQHHDIALQQLRDFYHRAGPLDHLPFNALNWRQVAEKYVEEYKKL